MLHNWVEHIEKYDFRWGTLGDGQCKICGWIEEHLNYWNWKNDKNRRWDIMIPIKEKA